MSTVSKDVASDLAGSTRLTDEMRVPFPHSDKVYASGSRPDIRVPMREVSQSSTPATFGVEKNPPITIYDCSGPYTDPNAEIDLTRGLPALRAAWIAERGDTEALTGLSSEFGRARAADAATGHLRFPDVRTPHRAKPGSNVSQMHYARAGIVTPEMEYVAIRENAKIDQIIDSRLLRRHPGEGFGANLPERVTPEFVRDEIAAGRAILPNNINHPESRIQNPESRIRADDHRP